MANKDFVIENGVLVSYNGNEKDITIPADVTVIGAQAFANKEFIESVVIPEGVKELENSAFELCEKLVEVKLPNSLEKIGAHCFEDCSSLMAVNIPNGVKTIEHHGFFNCGLKTVSIPESVENLGYLTFAGFNPIESINIAADNKDYKSVDGVVYSKSMDTLFMYPGYKSAKKFEIPNGVKTIFGFAFAGAAGVEVVIPNSVTEIMEKAFMGAVMIGDIHVPESVGSIGQDAFMGCVKTTIHGKAGSAAEKAATRDNVKFSAE